MSPQAREHGGLPVLVTSMHRRTFDADGRIVNSLGDYPEAVRQAAREEGVPLIDLNAMSKPLYEALGPGGSAKAFVDGTHHNNYGSYELARCVVEGIRQGELGLAKDLAADVTPFDPGHPDPARPLRGPRESPARRYGARWELRPPPRHPRPDRASDHRRHLLPTRGASDETLPRA